MTDHLYECHIDGCEYSTDDHSRLPSHVSGKRGSEAHQTARESKSWRDWYPDVFGVDEPEDGDESPSEGVESNDGASVDPPEPDESDDSLSEGAESDDGDSMTPSDAERGSDTPQKGTGSRDDYAEQWSEGSEGNEAPPSEGSESNDGESTIPSDDEGGSPPSGTPSKGGTRRLATLAAPLVALLLLLVRGDRDDPDDEVVDAGDATSEQPKASSSSTDQFSTIQ